MLVLNDSAGQLLATVTRALAGHGLATSWEPGRPESSGPADGVATLVMDGMTCVLPFQIKAQLRPSTVGLLPATLSPGTYPSGIPSTAAADVDSTAVVSSGETFTVPVFLRITAACPL